MRFKIDDEKCISCLMCQSACPNQAIELLDPKIQINQNLCDGCGTCVMICPTQAIETISEKVPIQLEESDVPSVGIEKNQNHLKHFQTPQNTKPNFFDDLKNSVLDSLMTPGGSPVLNRKGTPICGGGKGSGRQHRKRKKW
jgi:Fe-S-cluster-containing hydrogenase component 2